jgi:hypothetical protein
MFEWLVQRYLDAVKSLPILFADETSANFELIRTMLGLLLFVFVVYLIAMRPFRATINHCWKWIAGLVARKW